MKMDFRETLKEPIEWIKLAYDRDRSLALVMYNQLSEPMNSCGSFIRKENIRFYFDGLELYHLSITVRFDSSSIFELTSTFIS